MSKFISAVVDEYNPDWVNVTIESNFDGEEWEFNFPYKYKDCVATLLKTKALKLDEYVDLFDDLYEFREGVDDCMTVNDIFTLYNKEIVEAIEHRNARDAFILEIAPTIVDKLSPKMICDSEKIYEFHHENYEGVTLMFSHDTKTNEFFIVYPM